MRTKPVFNQSNHNHSRRFKIDICKSISSAIDCCLRKHNETLDLNRDKVAILIVNVILAQSAEESLHYGAKPGDFVKSLEDGLLPMCANSELHYGKLRPLINKQDWNIIQKMSVLKTARRVYNRSKSGDVVLIFDETGIPGRCGVRVSRIRL